MLASLSSVNAPNSINNIIEEKTVLIRGRFFLFTLHHIFYPFSVVGYQTVSTNAAYYSGGATFLPVGATTASLTLGDIKAEGMDPFGDMIQFLSTDAAKTYLSATYIDAATALENEDPALEGWWDVNALGEISYNNVSIDAGTAFLCAFSSGNTVKFTYAGQVTTGERTVNVPAGTAYPFLCNLQPVNLKLGDIKANGMDPFGDMIQFLSTDAAKTYLSATYIDAATALENEDPALEGWWDVNALGEISYNDVDLPAGSAFLGAISSGNAVTFVFPDVTAPKAE